MSRALSLIILIAVIFAIIALRERPARLAVEPTPAKVTKVQAPMCTAPWVRVQKKPRSIA